MPPATRRDPLPATPADPARDPDPAPAAPSAGGPVPAPDPVDAGEPLPRLSRAGRPASPVLAVDPVVALLHRHRTLCEQAVDPLEIAAGLEAHGVSDRAAAHFRHRDVFSLAEELYARVPHADGRDRTGTGDAPVPGIAGVRAVRRVVGAVRAGVRGTRPGAGAVVGGSGAVGRGQDGIRSGTGVPVPGVGSVRRVVGAVRAGVRGTWSGAGAVVGGSGAVRRSRDGVRSRFGAARHEAAGAVPGGVGPGPGTDGLGRRAGTARCARRWARSAAHLLPGALCAATVEVLRTADGTTPGVRWGIGALGAALIGLTLAGCLRHGPLRTLAPPAAGSATGGAALCGLGWLLGYLLCGDTLLAEVLHGGPDTGRPLAAPPVSPHAAGSLTALALALAPAACCAGWFAARARRGLRLSQGLTEFAAGTRPLLGTAVALFLGALTALVLGVGAVLPGMAGPGGADAAAVVALGGLCFLARLLVVHGRPRAAGAGLLAAGALEVLAVCSVLAARLPGCAPVGRPVRWAVAAHGPGAVPALACALTGTALLAHALRVLSQAAAHRPHPETAPPVPPPRLRAGTPSPASPSHLCPGTPPHAPSPRPRAGTPPPPARQAPREAPVSPGAETPGGPDRPWPPSSGHLTDPPSPAPPG
ncbi:hypothetical protein ACZ90_57000 [Streptomyces albus subsp. albus]|nr:hypothetical protein ACZ90_57000 [Streptomyces albus subsp. albus]